MSVNVLMLNGESSIDDISEIEGSNVLLTGTGLREVEFSVCVTRVTSITTVQCRRPDVAYVQVNDSRSLFDYHNVVNIRCDTSRVFQPPQVFIFFKLFEKISIN